MESYSLYQLNEYIRRVIALNFREPLWIEAEISQCKDSRGNVYLELIQKEEDGDDIIAQISGAIWYRNYKFIAKKHGDLIEDLLIAGTQVRLKCTVDFHERYGIKLLVQDIDPNFTFGKLELKRQQIINQLEAEGLMDLNSSLLIPNVIQRIAVISSAQAAGYQDFYQHLTNNGYGYTFKIDLYPCAVQGLNVTPDTTAAIESIKNSKVNYDIVTIIRGGGSKLDLSGYDSYEIARDIALSDIPFVIGIGHDIDVSVTDMVSCLSLKTPTAVADYIIEQNMNFESRVEQMIAQLIRQSESLLRQEEMKIRNLQDRLETDSKYLLADSGARLSQMEESLASATNNHLLKSTHQLDLISLKLDAQDPQLIMNKGYAYLTKEKVQVDSAKSLTTNDLITIHLSDGQKEAKVK